MWGINTCGRLSAPSMLNIPPVHMNIRHLLGSVMGSDFLFERKRLPPGRWIPLERFFDFLWAWGPSSKLWTLRNGKQTRPEAKRTLDDWTFALVSVWPKVPEARALKWRIPHWNSHQADAWSAPGQGDRAGLQFAQICGDLDFSIFFHVTQSYANLKESYLPLKIEHTRNIGFILNLIFLGEHIIFFIASNIYIYNILCI
jgi:hypothetical protein